MFKSIGTTQLAQHLIQCRASIVPQSNLRQSDLAHDKVNVWVRPKDDMLKKFICLVGRTNLSIP